MKTPSHICATVIFPCKNELCRNCDYRLVLCIAVSSFPRFVRGARVLRSEFSCPFWFLGLFFVNGCDIPTATATFSIIQSFSINISLCHFCLTVTASEKLSDRWQPARDGAPPAQSELWCLRLISNSHANTFGLSGWLLTHSRSGWKPLLHVVNATF